MYRVLLEVFLLDDPGKDTSVEDIAFAVQDGDPGVIAFRSDAEVLFRLFPDQLHSRINEARDHFIAKAIQYEESPETTGEFTCKVCGNREVFEGVDSDGYGGPDECECEAGDDDSGETECKCTAILRQPFTITMQPDEERKRAPREIDYDYQEFTGGGADAEIGEYDQINCGKCGATLWSDNDESDWP